MKTSLFLGTALTALLVTGMAGAATKSYVAPELEGAKEKPTAVESAATAEARFTYDDVTKKLCGHIKTTPSTFTATLAHIHAGDAETAGPPKITFDAPFTGELKINQVLTAEEAAALEGDAYVNLHTALHEGGELRDQLAEDGDTEAADEVCEGDDTDAGTPAVDSGTSSSSSSSSSGTTATPAATDDGGCNTSGSSNTGSGIAIAAGLGLVLAAASRKRNKKA